MKTINTAVVALEKSPLFNLSLASKELFHSNFLEWLMKTDSMRDVAAALLREFAGGIDLNLDTLEKPKREDNNFDLTLKVKNYNGKQYQIVVENKVKSLPSREQLDKYSAKLAKKPTHVDETIAVLLSLTSSDFFEHGSKCYSPKEGPSWKFFSYSKLLEVLGSYKSEDPYHDGLLTDYRKFIRGLIDLQTAIHDTFQCYPEALINPFDWPQKKEGSIYSQLKEIRMHDVFEKWRMRHLKEELEKCFDSDELDFEVGFSRGSGILNILPKDRENKMFYCVSCQTKQLRQVLVKPDGLKIKDDIFKKAQADLEKAAWFLGPSGKELPQCGKEENNYFCRYGNNFAYRYEALSNFDRLKMVARDLLSAPAP